MILVSSIPHKGEESHLIDICLQLHYDTINTTSTGISGPIHTWPMFPRQFQDQECSVLL